MSSQESTAAISPAAVSNFVAPGDNSLQEAAIAFVIANGKEMHIFLVNGIKLQGVILAQDSQAIALEHKGSFQLVYKRAISTIAPQQQHPMPFSHLQQFIAQARAKLGV